MKQPMLAASLEDASKLKFPIMVSPKLDGVRCVIREGTALSRSLKPIPNKWIQQQIRKHGSLEGLDGELVVGKPYDPNVMQNTTSGVMSIDGEPDFTYYVFDKHMDAPYFNRLAEARAMVAAVGVSYVKPVIHKLIKTQQELDDYEAKQLLIGYEGVMIRDPNGRYKEGRSTIKEGGLIKLKRFLDSEAVVLSVVEQMQNTNEAKVGLTGYKERSNHKAGMVGKGTLGAIRVRDLKTLVDFEIGTGFDDETRRRLWADLELEGKIVKYRYQPTGMLNKPRFPVFLGFRDSRDM